MASENSSVMIKMVGMPLPRLPHETENDRHSFTDASTWLVGGLVLTTLTAAIIGNSPGHQLKKMVDRDGIPGLSIKEKAIIK